MGTTETGWCRSRNRRRSGVKPIGAATPPAPHLVLSIADTTDSRFIPSCRRPNATGTHDVPLATMSLTAANPRSAKITRRSGDARTRTGRPVGRRSGGGERDRGADQGAVADPAGHRRDRGVVHPGGAHRRGGSGRRADGVAATVAVRRGGGIVGNRDPAGASGD